MRSDWIAKGLIISVLKTSKDGDGTTCLGRPYSTWLSSWTKEITYFCMEKGWEWFPVASHLAAVMSGARTEAEERIFLS